MAPLPPNKYTCSYCRTPNVEPGHSCEESKSWPMAPTILSDDMGRLAGALEESRAQVAALTAALAGREIVQNRSLIAEDFCGILAQGFGLAISFEDPSAVAREAARVHHELRRGYEQELINRTREKDAAELLLSAARCAVCKSYKMRDEQALSLGVCSMDCASKIGMLDLTAREIELNNERAKRIKELENELAQARSRADHSEQRKRADHSEKCWVEAKKRIDQLEEELAVYEGVHCTVCLGSLVGDEADDPRGLCSSACTESYAAQFSVALTKQVAELREQLAARVDLAACPFPDGAALLVIQPRELGGVTTLVGRFNVAIGFNEQHESQASAEARLKHVIQDIIDRAGDWKNDPPRPDIDIELVRGERDKAQRMLDEMRADRDRLAEDLAEMQGFLVTPGEDLGTPPPADAHAAARRRAVLLRERIKWLTEERDEARKTADSRLQQLNRQGVAFGEQLAELREEVAYLRGLDAVQAVADLTRERDASRLNAEEEAKMVDSLRKQLGEVVDQRDELVKLCNELTLQRDSAASWLNPIPARFAGGDTRYSVPADVHAKMVEHVEYLKTPAEYEAKMGAPPPDGAYAPVERVDHPPHYQRATGVEAIEVCTWVSFCLGNAVKYLWRSGIGRKVEDVSARRSLRGLDARQGSQSVDERNAQTDTNQEPVLDDELQHGDQAQVSLRAPDGSGNLGRSSASRDADVSSGRGSIEQRIQQPAVGNTEGQSRTEENARHAQQRREERSPQAQLGSSEADSRRTRSTGAEVGDGVRSESRAGSANNPRPKLASLKGGDVLEDLQKAFWYLKREHRGPGRKHDSMLILALDKQLREEPEGLLADVLTLLREDVQADPVSPDACRKMQERVAKEIEKLGGTVKWL